MIRCADVLASFDAELNESWHEGYRVERRPLPVVSLGKGEWVGGSAGYWQVPR